MSDNKKELVQVKPLQVKVQGDGNGEPSSNGKKSPPPDPGKLPGLPPSSWAPMIGYFAVMLGMLWFWQEASHQLNTRTIPYSEFKELVHQRQVGELTVTETDITGKLLGAAAVESKINPETNAVKTSTNSATSKAAITAPPMFRTVRVEDPNLVQDLQNANIGFSGVRPTFMTQLFWAWVLPIAAMMLMWRFLSRRMGNLGQNLMSFGASKARLVADEETGVTFGDVAGCEEAKFELQEVVMFLKDPSRYKSLGATMPKGILLIGPPGTGKTLLARAVAGEAKVPFFLISGSDFVEMFVGVGASRVRDLFLKAKAQAPCIVFIDELDAVGRQRGVHMGPVNDEREQTLNALLVGMDGFEANAGVIVLAATNRPEVLDRALLRPGRFDRQVLVDAPDLEGRLAILKLHVRTKPLSDDADLRRIAAQTPGFSGADLANVTNEAALLAARHGGKVITHRDFEDAVDKVVAGPERKSRRLNEEEKRRVAYHEVGHALVAAHCVHADEVHKITIIPHGRAALGYTMQLPTEDRYLMSRSDLRDRLKGLLGGRVAEEIVFSEISTGAENDLERATALARQMVSLYGMSSVIGLAHCAQRQGILGGAPDGVLQRDCSEATAREIDEEVKKLLDEARVGAREILERHRDQLERVTARLLEHETLDGKMFKALLEETPPRVLVAHN